MAEGQTSAGLPMPLPVAILVFAITLGFGGGYIGMKTWFYFLNARFRKNCAAVRQQLAGEATLSDNYKRAVFVGFFHPYWYSRSSDFSLFQVMQVVEVNEFFGQPSKLFRTRIRMSSR
jgi:hypothetical protein